MERNQGDPVVLDPTRNMAGSGRHVTTENFFTSFRLAQKLAEKQMTLLGTIRKNRQEWHAQTTHRRRVFLLQLGREQQW